jgi:hypothetical protein
MQRRLMLPALLLPLLALAACGGDGESADEFTQNVAAGLKTDSDFESDALTDEDYTCFAKAFVDGAGKEAMIANGLNEDGTGELGEDGVMEEAAARSTAEKMVACDGIGTLLISSMTGDGLAVSDESATCLTDSMRESGLLEEIFYASFSGDESGGTDEQNASILTSMTDCFSPEELAEVMG